MLDQGEVYITGVFVRERRGRLDTETEQRRPWEDRGGRASYVVTSQKMP